MNPKLFKAVPTGVRPQVNQRRIGRCPRRLRGNIDTGRLDPGLVLFSDRVMLAS